MQYVSHVLVINNKEFNLLVFVLKELLMEWQTKMNREMHANPFFKLYRVHRTKLKSKVRN